MSGGSSGSGGLVKLITFYSRIDKIYKSIPCPTNRPAKFKRGSGKKKLTMTRLLNKFRGSLVGGLIGDCLGQPFEGEAVVYLHHLNNYFKQLYDPNVKIPYKPYTDDTALTKCVAQSLIENKELNPQDLAKKMTVEYFADTNRGYGKSIHDVFMKLRNSKFEDPFYPAKGQFGGHGSFGNGSAMRIAPVALFSHSDLPNMINIVERSSQITHFHKLGIRGAILQALSIRQAVLHESKGGDLDVIKFVNDLIDQMKEIERGDELGDPLNELDDGKSYVKKLEFLKVYLSKSQVPSVQQIQDELGVHVSAFSSVPTALFCFLASQKNIDYLENFDSKFARGIQLAISLGGDTDTIASMCGNISGAYFGYTEIPQELLKHVENPQVILKLATDLYGVSEKIENHKEAAVE